MSMPETVRVKISTEAAESISFTPVVLRDMPLRELIELMLGLTGKEPERLRELLLRGTLVSGASRFRWEALEVPPAALDQVLASFPDPDPARPFTPAACFFAVLHGPGARVELPREAAIKRRLLRRRCFWDVLLEVASASVPRYVEYSYHDGGDWYRIELRAEQQERLRSEASLVPYPTLARQLRDLRFRTLDLYVRRQAEACPT